MPSSDSSRCCPWQRVSIAVCWLCMEGCGGGLGAIWKWDLWRYASHPPMQLSPFPAICLLSLALQRRRTLGRLANAEGQSQDLTCRSGWRDVKAAKQERKTALCWWPTLGGGDEWCSGTHGDEQAFASVRPPLVPLPHGQWVAWLLGAIRGLLFPRPSYDAPPA